jgi:hypothetical protein
MSDNPFKFKVTKGNDTMIIEIMDGGIIKITSEDAISAPNHSNAESLIREIKKDAGGKATHKHLKKGHVHTHGGVAHRH